jgi:hypothetical protein
MPGLGIGLTDMAVLRPGRDRSGPTIPSGAAVSVAENAILVHSLLPQKGMTWTITGGPDAALFEIGGATLRWAANGTRDFEAPDDADADNAYVVQVTATDGALNATAQIVTVTVTDVAEGSPELWPQPDFASSDGIVLDAGGGMMPTIGGGVLTFFDDGDPSIATAIAAEPLAAGTYHYELTIDSVTGVGVEIIAGGYGPGFGLSGVGSYSDDFEIGGEIDDTIALSGGFTAAAISHFSLTKVA